MFLKCSYYANFKVPTLVLKASYNTDLHALKVKKRFHFLIINIAPPPFSQRDWKRLFKDSLLIYPALLWLVRWPSLLWLVLS